MNDLQELIEMTNKISSRIDNIINCEFKLCENIKLSLEQISWEMTRQSNELDQIKRYVA